MPSESPDPNVEAVRDLLLNRSQKGLTKYGVTTADNPLSLAEWLRHKRDEQADELVYTQAAIRKAEAAEAVVEAAREVLHTIETCCDTEDDDPNAVHNKLRDALNRYNGGSDGC